MNILSNIEQTAIRSFVELVGHGDLFSRVLAEVKRTNKTMPDATGKEKRNKVFANFKIIFDDVVEPVCESILRMLLELAVNFLKAKAKAATV